MQLDTVVSQTQQECQYFVHAQPYLYSNLEAVVIFVPFLDAVPSIIICSLQYETHTSNIARDIRADPLEKDKCSTL